MRPSRSINDKICWRLLCRSFFAARPRKEQIRKQLLEYCGMDTRGMMRIWQVFAGRVRNCPEALRFTANFHL